MLELTLPHGQDVELYAAHQLYKHGFRYHIVNSRPRLNLDLITDRRVWIVINWLND